MVVVDRTAHVGLGFAVTVAVGTVAATTTTIAAAGAFGIQHASWRRGPFTVKSFFTNRAGSWTPSTVKCTSYNNEKYLHVIAN